MMRLVPFFLLIIASVGCNYNSSDKARALHEEQIRDSIQRINEVAHDSLIRKFGAIESWDTLANWTYEFHQFLTEENRIICFEGKVRDISKSDGVYLLHLSERFGRKYLRGLIGFNLTNLDLTAVVRIDSNKVRQINSVLDPKMYSSEGSFILEVTDVILFEDCSDNRIEIRGKVVDFHLDKGENLFNRR